jgi:hypothetical protein
MSLHLDCDEDGAIFHDSVELLVGEDGVRRPWHRHYIYYSHFTIADNEKLGIVTVCFINQIGHRVVTFILT